MGSLIRLTADFSFRTKDIRGSWITIKVLVEKNVDHKFYVNETTIINIIASRLTPCGKQGQYSNYSYVVFSQYL